MNTDISFDKVLLWDTRPPKIEAIQWSGNPTDIQKYRDFAPERNIQCSHERGIWYLEITIDFNRVLIPPGHFVVKFNAREVTVMRPDAFLEEYKLHIP